MSDAELQAFVVDPDGPDRFDDLVDGAGRAAMTIADAGDSMNEFTSLCSRCVYLSVFSGTYALFQIPSGGWRRGSDPHGVCLARACGGSVFTAANASAEALRMTTIARIVGQSGRRRDWPEFGGGDSAAGFRWRKGPRDIPHFAGRAVFWACGGPQGRSRRGVLLHGMEAGVYDVRSSGARVSRLPGIGISG